MKGMYSQDHVHPTPSLASGGGKVLHWYSQYRGLAAPWLPPVPLQSQAPPRRAACGPWGAVCGVALQLGLGLGLV